MTSIEIIRGTTPTISAKIPNTIPLDEVSEIWFSISQNGIAIVDRKLSDNTIMIDGQVISITLTQEETLKFRTYSNVECGIRLRVGDNALATSTPIFAKIIDVTKGGVI